MSVIKKIIVVDDSEASLYLVKAIFENDKDIMVLIESDSRHALKILKEEMPDLIILDIMMPHIDGFMFLEKVKADPVLSQIPVLIISAKTDYESIERARQYNVNGYIKKPIDLREMEIKVKSIVKYAESKTQ